MQRPEYDRLRLHVLDLDLPHPIDPSDLGRLEPLEMGGGVLDGPGEPGQAVDRVLVPDKQFLPQGEAVAAERTAPGRESHRERLVGRVAQTASDTPSTSTASRVSVAKSRASLRVSQ